MLLYEMEKLEEDTLIALQKNACALLVLVAVMLLFDIDQLENIMLMGLMYTVIAIPLLLLVVMLLKVKYQLEDDKVILRMK